ncbi:MAG: phosphatidate cytidylyltransferase, partial [Oscillospiraceae bacterium]|nr:phosphatidate cytidylyltransferase [Oscillospiraceae bacterium]
GMFLGKHKLAPRLSPKKTIEGSAGGFLGTIVCMLIYGIAMSAGDYTVNYSVLAVYGYLGSLAGQLGDLSFSAIKRLHDVKDYSHIIPGHGGILDRFDSMLFIAPLIELLMMWVPAVM